MEHQNAKFLRAIADGKTVQIKTVRDMETVWQDVSPTDWIRLGTCSSACFRIKPDAKWYRVALFKAGPAIIGDKEEQEGQWPNFPNFVRWLTDRIEYEA